MYILCNLGGGGGCCRSALLHLVCEQEELEHRVKVLHDGVLYAFLQQVPLRLDFCVFIPFQCFHGGLQEPQAYQHRTLGLGKVEKQPMNEGEVNIFIDDIFESYHLFAAEPIPKNLPQPTTKYKHPIASPTQILVL